MNARPKASGYSEAGASMNRRAFKGFTGVSSSPNEDINWNNFTLRQRARMLAMSSPLAASAIKTNRTKVVGVGLSCKPMISTDILGLSPDAAKKWQRNTEREFKLWAGKKQNCDAIGMNNFAGMQQLALQSWMLNGDVFALKTVVDPTPLCPYSLRYHLIEADRISTPTPGRLHPFGPTDGINPKNKNRIFDGVEVDKSGAVVAYHICNTYPTQRYRCDEKPEWQRVKAYGAHTGLPNILHIMVSERCDQYRGVTYLAPVMESLLNISRYTQSELMAALIQSFFTAWIITTTEPNKIPVNEVGYGDTDDPDDPPDSNISEHPNEYEMGPGTLLHLQPGEDVKFGNPNIPSAGFDTFFKVICKELGAALEIPYDILLKEFNASYSASRAALMEAFEAFKMRRKWLVDAFCQPVYESWLAEAVAIGRIKAPGFWDDPSIRDAWCKAQWLGPVQGQLDPTKEVKADILAVSQGFKTRDQVTREYGGGDWHDNMEAIKEENKMLADAGGKNTTDATDLLEEPENNEKGTGDDAAQ